MTEGLPGQISPSCNWQVFFEGISRRAGSGRRVVRVALRRGARAPRRKRGPESRPSSRFSREPTTGRRSPIRWRGRHTSPQSAECIAAWHRHYLSGVQPPPEGTERRRQCVPGARAHKPGIPFVRDERGMLRQAQALLDGLGARVRASASVASLSVSQQQMVEIARALSMNARVVIMDKPSATLSDHEVQRLFEAIRRLQARGIGVIYISHRLEEATEIGDRATICAMAASSPPWMSSIYRTGNHPPDDRQDGGRALPQTRGRPWGRSTARGRTGTGHESARHFLCGAARRDRRHGRSGGIGPHPPGTGHLRAAAPRSWARVHRRAPGQDSQPAQCHSLWNRLPAGGPQAVRIGAGDVDSRQRQPGIAWAVRARRPDH